MHLRLLEVLACPKCADALACETTKAGDDGEVIEGKLDCAGCSASFPIVETIPRFVPHDNYAASFGYQWNLFRREQMDTDSGSELSARRFFSETGWAPEQMKGRWVLDVGCGAGRFLEIVAETGAEAIGLDISSAIDATRENLKDAKTVHLVQASALEPPFRKGALDFVYCIGVAQHTPDPPGVMRLLPQLARQGGEVAVTVYERRPWTMLNAKYLVRPLTRRMPNERLLKKIRDVMPMMFPLTDVLFRIPLLGRLFEFTIPIANYVRETRLNRQQRYEWAVLDTFDMLSPAFDQPQTAQEIERALGEGGLAEMRRLPNPGANIVGRKPQAA